MLFDANGARNQSFHALVIRVVCVAMAWDPRMDKYGAVRKAPSVVVAWACFNPLPSSYLRCF